MTPIRIRLSDAVFEFSSAIALELGGSLEQFQAPELEPDHHIYVRYARPGEPTPHQGGYAAIGREGSDFEIALSQPWPKPSVWQMLSMLPLPELLLEHDTMILHASCILVGGEAIAFSGPSGIGKSTQASLWQRHRNARILNGDRVLLTPREDHILLHSHYLSGTSGICENGSAPLRALILLGQAPRSFVYAPSPLDAFRRVLSQTDYDPGNREQMIRITMLAEKLLSLGQVWCLDCTMDESAVTCLEKHLYEEFHHPNHP